MDKVYLYIISLVLFNFLETSLSIFAYAYNLNKKNKFAIRTVLTCLGYCLLYSIIYYINFNIIKHFNYGIEPIEYCALYSTIVNIFVILFIYFFLFNEKKTILLFYSIASQMTNLIFSSLYNMITLFFNVPEIRTSILDGFYFSAFISYIIVLIIVFLSAFLINKRQNKKYSKESFLLVKNYVFIFFILVEIIIIFLESTMRMRGYNDNIILMWLDIFQLLVCSIILLVMFFLLNWSRDIKEKIMIDNQYQLYKNQQQMIKESIDMINIKCHDLKHLITQKLETKNIDNDFIEDVNKSINIYDTNIDVGNDTLYVLLSQKSLQCRNNDIDLSILLDANKLDFISSSDLFSLFGNALDNAFECELKENKEDRFIKIKSISKDNFIIIKIENYCSQDINMNNKLIKTTKNDKFNHGFGIKSMKNIVSKYQGELNILKENNVFELTIFLPINNTK